MKTQKLVQKVCLTVLIIANINQKTIEKTKTFIENSIAREVRIKVMRPFVKGRSLLVYVGCLPV